MDGKPLFRFDLRIDDEGARRAFYKLARLEDGLFDKAGFEEAVDDWRITTEVKPKAIGIFQQWYEGYADDLGKLLAQQLTPQDDRTEDRLVNSLAAEWFKEFVDGSTPSRPLPYQPQQATQSQPQAAYSEWRPLPEWQVVTKQDMPDEIRFPDLITAPIHNGYDVPVEVTRWLRKTGYLKDDHIPIRTGKKGKGKSYLVSFTKENSMLTPKEVQVEGAGSVWVATGFSAEYQVINARNIMTGRFRIQGTSWAGGVHNTINSAAASPICSSCVIPDFPISLEGEVRSKSPGRWGSAYTLTGTGNSRSMWQH